MKDTCYIIFTQTGISRMVKRGSTQLEPHERMFQLDVEYPEEAFAPPPIPRVKMQIPAEAVTRNIELTIEGETI